MVKMWQVQTSQCSWSQCFFKLFKFSLGADCIIINLQLPSLFFFSRNHSSQSISYQSIIITLSSFCIRRATRHTKRTFLIRDGRRIDRYDVWRSLTFWLSTHFPHGWSEDSWSYYGMKRRGTNSKGQLWLRSKNWQIGVGRSCKRWRRGHSEEPALNQNPRSSTEYGAFVNALHYHTRKLTL